MPLVLWFEDLPRFLVESAQGRSSPVCALLGTWAFHFLSWSSLVTEIRVSPNSQMYLPSPLQALDVSDHFPVEFKLQASKVFTNRKKSVSSKRGRKARRS